jgi:hypothetical protein
LLAAAVVSVLGGGVFFLRLQKKGIVVSAARRRRLCAGSIKAFCNYLYWWQIASRNERDKRFYHSPRGHPVLTSFPFSKQQLAAHPVVFFAMAGRAD